jgi:ABC-type multidrug transport system fused ATPase/permease subunit
MAILFTLVVVALFLLASLFWLWMLVDCAVNESGDGNDKLVWIIIIVFTHFIGAVVYFFFRRPQRFEGTNAPQSNRRGMYPSPPPRP